MLSEALPRQARASPGRVESSRMDLKPREHRPVARRIGAAGLLQQGNCGVVPTLPEEIARQYDARETDRCPISESRCSGCRCPQCGLSGTEPCGVCLRK